MRNGGQLNTDLSKGAASGGIINPRLPPAAAFRAKWAPASGLHRHGGQISPDRPAGRTPQSARRGEISTQNSPYRIHHAEFSTEPPRRSSRNAARGDCRQARHSPRVAHRTQRGSCSRSADACALSATGSSMRMAGNRLRSSSPKIIWLSVKLAARSALGRRLMAGLSFTTVERGWARRPQLDMSTAPATQCLAAGSKLEKPPAISAAAI